MKSKLLCVLVSVFVLAWAGAVFGASELMVLEPSEPGKPGNLIPLSKFKANITEPKATPLPTCEWNYEIEYLTGDFYYYIPRAEGDTVGVWFQSPAACSLCAIVAIRYFGGVAEGTQGTPIHYFVFDVVPDYPFEDMNRCVSPSPSPLVYPPLYGPDTLISPSENYLWDSCFVEPPIDVGTDPFIGCYAIQAENQATLSDDGSVFTGHSIMFVQKYCDEPGWYNHYVNFGFKALVKAYENLPPKFITDPSLPWTYSTDERKVQVNLVDILGVPIEQTGVAWDSLYYSVNCGPWNAVACSLVSGDPTDGIWEGTIPGVSVYDHVDYYHVAGDLQGATTQGTMHSYKVIKGSNLHILYVVESGAYYGMAPDAVAAGAQDFVDYWFARDYGTPPKEVIDFYTPGTKGPHGQPIIVWHGWGGGNLYEATEDIIGFLDAGGNLLISGQDMLYNYVGTYDYTTVDPGTFLYDYLKITGVHDDFNHDSVVTFYGVPGDIISDGFETGIDCSPYCWAGNYTWTGMVELVDGVGCFYYETGEIAGYHYQDATKGYKLVLFYFPHDYLMKLGEFCVYDTAAQVQLMTNALYWLDVVFGVEDVANAPNIYFLSQNKPNPVASTATISFSVPKATDVSLKVYDATGRVVSTLVNGKVDAGTHTVAWNANDVASGVYFYRLSTDEFTKTRKMVVLH